MSLIELIGFVISLVAMFYLWIKTAREKSRANQPPLHIENQEKEPELLNEFFQSLHNQTPEPQKSIKRTSQKPAIQRPPKKAHSVIDKRSVWDDPQPMQDNAYAIQQKQQRPIRAIETIKELRSKRDMLIIKEIFGPPKADIREKF